MVFGKTLHAFIDESGDTSLDTEKAGVSELFVVTAILVGEDDLEAANDGAEAIRKKHFQTGEMKSSGVAAKSSRRARIIAELCQLPIRTAQLVVDKASLNKAGGLSYKKSFFKYVNRQLYTVLTRSFDNLAILADEHGRDGYMASFKTYINKRIQRDLFQQRTVDFANSRSQVLIQVADMFAGTVARCVDSREDEASRQKLWPLLTSKAVWLAVWPPSKQPAEVAGRHDEPTHDELIREYCLRQARVFLDRMLAKDEYADHVGILEMLYMHAVFAEDRFLSSAELLERLGRAQGGERDIQQAIRELRDDGVLVASSRRGYKIPTAVSDMESFVAHANSIVPPMLDRLASARSALLTTSMGEIDILSATEFDRLRVLAADHRIPDFGVES